MATRTKTKRTTTKANARKYEQQWDVPSESDPSSYYTVSLTSEGEYKCHCWPYLRSHEPCKHIRQVTAGQIAPRGTQAPSAARENWNFDQAPVPTEVSTREPRIVFCNVRCVTPIGNADQSEVIELNTPLIKPNAGNEHLLLTVLFDLAQYGIGWGTLRKEFHLPRDLNLTWVQSYIHDYGRLIYGPLTDGVGFDGFTYIPPDDVNRRTP
jgi:hypothetical protein